MLSDARILVVDDDSHMRNMLTTALSRIQGYSVLEADSGEKGLALVRDDEPDLILSDMKMPGMTGLQLLKGVRDLPSNVPFIIVTAYGTVQDAVEAMRQGATDYLEKGDPNMLRTLEIKVKKCLELKSLLDENRALREELDRRYQTVGKSKPMEDVQKLVESVAQSHSTILITGESGTGKELVARALHVNSRRSKGPFIKINCAAMPDTLIESELFGHEKGSFTGALKRTRGKFELADGGTILLDEIGEMPMTTQAKLLRVLQEKEINKIGAEAPISIDVRIIATTNRNLREEIEKGRFREDLFFRLNVIPFALPPLRHRKDDIAVLCDHFIRKFNEENGYMVTELDSAALDYLKKYDWPGNVRELENAIERAVVLTKNGALSADVFQLCGALKKDGAGGGMRAGVTIAEMEKELIYKTLEHCQGNKTRVAEMLGISIRTLRNKLNEYEGKSGDPEEEIAAVAQGNS